MSHEIKSTKELQVGMVVEKDIVGKKGDVKVRRGEVLSDLHVQKLNKWKGLMEANNGSLMIKSDPTRSGSRFPSVEQRPCESPVIQASSKQKLASSMVVSVDIDKNGNVVRDEDERQESDAAVLPAKPKEPAKKRGRKPKQKENA